MKACTPPRKILIIITFFNFQIEIILPTLSGTNTPSSHMNIVSKKSDFRLQFELKLKQYKIIGGLKGSVFNIVSVWKFEVLNFI